MFLNNLKEFSSVHDNANLKTIYSKLQNFLGRAAFDYCDRKEDMRSAKASTVRSDENFLTPVSSVGDLMAASLKSDFSEQCEVKDDLLTGEIDTLWCFDKPETLTKFVTTCDSDHNEGYSTCKLEMSSAGRGLFHGYLDTRVPKDGRIKTAGYAGMRSIRLRKSFKRATTYDWHLYNTLVLKVRGDGRSYLLNISCEGYHDIMWNDIYHYVLYTRGGPYWQMAKIPFSKFVLGSKGRLQDKQTRFRFDKVTHFGISCGDKIDGRFNLEVEYIGLEFDPTHEEEFAYEMYKTDKYIVGV